MMGLSHLSEKQTDKYFISSAGCPAELFFVYKKKHTAKRCAFIIQ